jgi:hypothetical protein
MRENMNKEECGATMRDSLKMVGIKLGWCAYH